ncbi:MAG: hypothetical protein PHE36_11135 [Novosphingobium sp.]|nr:hypothetical protein [Novosphingobium sp.]
MSAPFDYWIPAAVLTALALLATIRLSLPSLIGKPVGGVLGVLTHPVWLFPFIFGIAVAVGLMIQGNLSPWPLAARADFAAKWGMWAGVAGFLLVLLVDIWLIWTPSMIARRFAKPESREAIKVLPLFNVVFGLVFLAIVLFVWR